MLFGASMLGTRSYAATGVGGPGGDQSGVPGVQTASGGAGKAAGAAVQVASADSQGPMKVTFNSRLFMGAPVDLSRYEEGNPVDPGVYPVLLTLNGERRGNVDVEFRAVDGSDVAEPCFTVATLEQLGVNTELLKRKPAPRDGNAGSADMGASAAFDIAGEASAAQAPLPSPAAQTSGPARSCMLFRDTLPEATYTFNSSDLKLDLTIPQADLRSVARGYVDPSRWDNGIDAGIFKYSLSAYSSRNNFGGNSNSIYAGLETGVNIGPWSLRQRSTLNWANGTSGMQWKNIATYAQRDLTSLRSRLTLGDSYTTGDLFDAFDLRGVQISSDDRMLPSSMQAYAPIIRGIADTNARVQVRQRGNVIYEANVPPGPFEFDDLPPIGYGGDLLVVVTESDGRVKQFTVPFSSVPQLLRPGMQRFNVSVGQYRDSWWDADPLVAQATYQRGITNLITGYTGVLASAGYGSVLFGVALNTPVGAVAFDATAARTDLPGSGAHTGTSLRLSYAKMVSATGTNFSVAAYRYSTSGFYGLADAINTRYAPAGNTTAQDYRARSRLQLNASQSIGERSSAYVSASVQDYWANTHATDVQFQVGVSSMFKNISYMVYAQRVITNGNAPETQVGVNLTIPLGRTSSPANSPFSSMTASLAGGTNGDNLVQTSVFGSKQGALPVDYGFNASRIANGFGSNLASVGAYGTVRAPFGTYNTNLSLTNQGQQAAFGANGAVVVHSGGVTFTPPLGAASALIKAEGAEGGRVINGQGAAIDHEGYAVIPSLTPYRVNTVALDPSVLSDDVELSSTSEDVVPRQNSIVLVKMATVRGRPIFAKADKADGTPVPMGSELLDSSGKAVGSVGQGGMAFIRGITGSGTLTARWGTHASDQCAMPYTVPAEDPKPKKHRPAVRIQLRCEE
jgi:outer membrane usher protein